MSLIDNISIKNFRGIEAIEGIVFDNFNIFIGNNGTCKTSIIEAINYAFSPSFLSGRIKHTDFHNGEDNPIEVLVNFKNNVKAKLPDGYTEREISCNRIQLNIKKRDRKAPGKAFSDIVTVAAHVLLPDFPKEGNVWNVKRKNDSDFKFDERLLQVSSINSEDLPRCFYFGKERDKQLYKGFNTSFVNIIEDLHWRYLKSLRKEDTDDAEKEDVNELIGRLEDDVFSRVEINKYEALKKFKDCTKRFLDDQIELSLIDASAPFENAFLSMSAGNIDLPIKYVGSGIEMILSILFLETLASLSKEKLLILIDEPELHLHPSLQEKLAQYLLEISADNQIFVTTHSPIFFKYCIGKNGVKPFIMTMDDKSVTPREFSLSNQLFPWSPSWGEINYLAYGYATIEFHDELYGRIQEKSQKSTTKDFDEFLYQNFQISKSKPWTKEKGGSPGNTEDVTLQTFIRNKIHHSENKTMQSGSFTDDELRNSIDQMIEILKKLNI